MDILIPIAITLAAIGGIGFVISRLYERSTRDQAYVRTGLGGKRVILDGGSIILPVFHSISWVTLNTLRLEVKRADRDSLITADRMRADISAEFYVRVKPDEASVALAAQTLGDRTNDADALRQLIEAKFVDALRAVAAKMTLVELQEKRTDFVKEVQTAVAADLQSNGLELESVSLTRLDQTDKAHFNENNTFDAEGLTHLTKITESRRNERNTVTRETEVSIARKNRETALQQLEIQRETREAELQTERDIANETAKTRAETAEAEQRAQKSEATARIERELAVAQAEALAGRERETAQIEAKMAVATRQTESARDVRIVEQESAIAVAEKSEAESVAKAKAEEARALAVRAEEKVATAREVEIAERRREITVIEAKQQAEREATAITVQAEAERKAAEDRAEAVKTQAAAESESDRVRAQGIEALGAAEAGREQAMNAARNQLDARIIEFEIQRERIRIIPQALAESMKAVERISEIRIFDTGGLRGAGGSGGALGGGGSLVEQLLSYQGQKPVLDKILQEAGFSGANAIDALTNGLVPAKTFKDQGTNGSVPEAAAPSAAPANGAAGEPVAAGPVADKRRAPTRPSA